MGLNVNILANGVFLISFPSAIYNLSSFVFFPSLPLFSIVVLISFGPMALFLFFIPVLRYVPIGIGFRGQWCIIQYRPL